MLRLARGEKRVFPGNDRLQANVRPLDLSGPDKIRTFWQLFTIGSLPFSSLLRDSTLMFKPSLTLLFFITHFSAAIAAGRLELRAVDKDTGKPLAVRLHLQNGQGKPYKPTKLKGGLAFGDHLMFSEKLVLDLPNGRYNFVMEHGPEYRIMNGHFDIENFADDSKTVEMSRFCDLAKEGWFSGDLDVQRPELELKQAMVADDLHLVPLITWSNKKNFWERHPRPKQNVSKFDDSYFYSVMGGEWTTPGNTLHLFRADQPITWPAELSASINVNSKSAIALGSLPLILLAAQARQEQSAWIDAGALFARDLPVWVAAGIVDSVQVANRHLLREGVIANEAGGWARDLALFPGAQGNGRWSQEIYYHLLNCGLRIPPTAGSGSGANHNAVGYNRVYVHVGETEATGDAVPDKLTWDGWWNGLRAGRVCITNGPLLRTRVEGEFPGHVFKADAGQSIELAIALTLSTRDKIRYLDVVKNGRTEITVSLDEFKQAGGKLPLLKFSESGWFVVRAVADTISTYRYASSGPYYVEIGYQPRISRSSVQFFLDWTNKRAEDLANSAVDQGLAEVIASQAAVKQAQTYWRGLLDKATTD